MTAVLVVCTANQCRSPIAAAVLRQRLPHGCGVTVDSAGLLDNPGRPVPDEGIDLMRRYGIDLTEHRSQVVAVDDVRRHDLILGMTRGHVRQLLALEPAAFARIFTLKDFVHRFEGADGDELADAVEAPWIALNAERERDSLLGSSELDDIRDPIGESTAVWTAVVNELVDYSDRLAFILGHARARAARTGRRAMYRR